MSRTDLNDVVRYRLITVGVLRLMGIWLIAAYVVPSLADGLTAWWQFASLTRQSFAFGGGVSMDMGMFWGTIGKSVGLLLIGLFLIVYARRLARKIIPVGASRCPGCDYDLSSARAPTCPECGLDLSSLGPAPVQSPSPDSQ